MWNSLLPWTICSACCSSNQWNDNFFDRSLNNLEKPVHQQYRRVIASDTWVQQRNSFAIEWRGANPCLCWLQHCQLDTAHTSEMGAEHHTAHTAALWNCIWTAGGTRGATHKPYQAGNWNCCWKSTEVTKCRIFAEQHWFHTANVKRHPTAWLQTWWATALVFCSRVLSLRAFSRLLFARASSTELIWIVQTSSMPFELQHFTMKIAFQHFSN